MVLERVMLSWTTATKTWDIYTNMRKAGHTRHLSLWESATHDLWEVKSGHQTHHGREIMIELCFHKVLLDMLFYVCRLPYRAIPANRDTYLMLFFHAVFLEVRFHGSSPVGFEARNLRGLQAMHDKLDLPKSIHAPAQQLLTRLASPFADIGVIQRSYAMGILDG